MYQLFSPVRLGRIARVRTAQVLGHLPRRELRFAHVPKVSGQMYRFACKTFKRRVTINVALDYAFIERTLHHSSYVFHRNNHAGMNSERHGRVQYYPNNIRTVLLNVFDVQKVMSV